MTTTGKGEDRSALRSHDAASDRGVPGSHPIIRIREAGRDYRLPDGRTVTALQAATLDIRAGEFICLLGPSGCGKTTLLNLVAGFDRPTAGEVLLHDAPVPGPGADRVTIFQQYGLLPWRSVLRNVELGLEQRRGMDRRERRRIAQSYLRLVGLEESAHRHPAQLSGGMQQRVALARALAVDPEILLMDEPFGALDAMTRMTMQDEIARLRREKGKTILFVTHDIEEAVFLADRIVVMTPGPGRVKCILDVPLGAARDRTSPDFLKLRDRVFAAFELKGETGAEYYL